MMKDILPYPMEDVNLDEMLKVAQPDEEGKIDYHKFVETMFEV